ncbi:putative bifunctional diguanylate cyclase/phosphodiesterase [Acholeplasma hippikon]|uniref:Bacteriophytochrome cph2 n=1 Tax=Acholeplasma hippikon TaxID=264636 RepID=A0A449BLC1_9MOLU|nr:bifunctional diguanylate cyclase/phosphodiesterase [Acholeplasma hippikon]VEU83236.1 Bacteriophytochrome cph2 [Acholeplasma hippikon]
MRQQDLDSNHTHIFCKKNRVFIVINLLIFLTLAIVDITMVFMNHEFNHLFWFDILRYLIVGTLIVSSFMLSYRIVRQYLSQKDEYLNNITSTSQTQLQNLEKKIKYDELTGLYNDDGIKEVIENLQKESKPYTLFNIDLDDFKLINDLKGMVWSDSALKEIANYLKERSETYEVARDHEDSFVLISLNEFTPDSISEFTKSLLKQIRVILHNEIHAYLFSASIGVASYYPNEKSLPDTLTKSELALHQAKISGKNRVVIYKDEFYQEKINEVLIMSAIKPSLKNNEFYLVYQPIMDIDKDQILGVETLLRWQHPELGHINPEKIIRLSELTDDIHRITNFVVKEAFRQLKAWNEQGIDIRLLINLSPKNLLDKTLPDTLIKYATEYGINPEDVGLEITESSKLEKLESVKEILERIKAYNFRIAIDDFGTGYSTLTYIKELPIDIVKLDRSFITNIDTNYEDQLFLKFVLDISNALRKLVIIEGVETEVQKQIIKEHQIALAQGYYFSKPKKAEELQCFFESYGLINQNN